MSRTRRFWIAVWALAGVLPSYVLADNGEASPMLNTQLPALNFQTANNVAFLRDLSEKSLSFIELYAQKNQGDFINYFQSDNSLDFDVNAGSWQRLDQRTVLYGTVEYQRFSGKNMSGSMLIEPRRNAFDLIELNTDASGEKTLERYHLAGGAAYDLSSRWTLGGQIDYTAANYSKHKDLRHVNSFLDFAFNASAIYHLKPTVAIGAAFLYGKSVEGLSFNTYGTTGTQYTSLVDFGAFFGRAELFGGDGYVDDDTNNPLVNHFTGAALQFQLAPNSHWQFFNEIIYRVRDGYYGKRSTTTPVYSEHNSTLFACRGQLTRKTDRHYHNFALSADCEQLANYENIFTQVTLPGNRREIIYSGSNQVGDKTWFNMDLGYTSQLFVRDGQPKLRLSAGVDFHNRQQTATLYPYFRKQDIHYYQARLSAEKLWYRRRNTFGVLLGARYGAGGNQTHTDGRYADSQTNSRTADNYLLREYEYLTAKRITGAIGLRYMQKISSGIQGYIQLYGESTHAFELQYLENPNFFALKLSLGCIF
ncbi:MAG: hypothetical protein LBR66_06450 [Candidatus Symbiothrix sp.]|jgi:hypothetical protein|nr:hypothetical protein [Candidatus Symbiothrix sp.]